MGLGHQRVDPRSLAGEDLGTRVVAAIGKRGDLLRAERLLSLFTHRGELRTIGTLVRHLVRHNHVMLGIDHALHVVAHDS
jgi:hypothetical protein